VIPSYYVSRIPYPDTAERSDGMEGMLEGEAPRLPFDVIERLSRTITGKAPAEGRHMNSLEA
jgi:hypothetical protein